ncbi:MAG TPA: LysR substrate-binding domain-containing protein [Longimicrobiales bacterium]
MELRQLRYFLAVADARHFTRAAEAVYVSQPALSQQIRALERELGAPLFDRLGRSVELTTAGRVLVDRARRILRDVEDAKAAVGDLARAVRGELSLAAVHTANLTVVVEVLARFRERYPGVVVRIHEARAADVVEAVSVGRVDLGITYLPVHEAGLESEPLYREELVLVVPAGHPLAGSTVRVAALAGMPLIVPPEGYCLRAGIDAVLAEAGARSRVVAEVVAPESICEAVRAGLGLSLLPADYVATRAARDGLATARLTDPVPTRTVGLLRRGDRHVCTATRAFIEALRETTRRAA